jgi:putative ABC transport system permease protein
MIRPKFIPLVIKQVTRHRVRSFLTVAGVGSAMFLFVAIEAIQSGVSVATQQQADDVTLVVYRENRFCPFTSRLPQYYGDQIARIPGVREVTPMKVVVNNCRASLDVVTFRGVRGDDAFVHTLDLASGSLQDWRRRSDAALVGEALFARRGLKVGDQFSAAGVSAYVAGAVRSSHPQIENVAFVHLDYLQQAVDRKLGIVTQFNVTVDDPSQLEAVSAAIDSHFASAEHPTTTRAEKAFVAVVAGDLLDLIAFTRYLGWGCLAAVLSLVCNAVVLSVQGRIKELAILKTLGYSDTLVARLIIAEGALLGLLGGAAGALGASALLRWQSFGLTVDGLTIPIITDGRVLGIGLGGAILVGILAGLVPALQSTHRSIVSSFRAV